LIAQIDSPEGWLKTLSHFFKKANKTWTIGIKGLQLELQPENHQDIPSNILDALRALVCSQSIFSQSNIKRTFRA
jgi:hypothetical protein